MEIHKPKPIHNLRDFLKEVGTIVLGVCIALAAEQAVEWLHWRAQVFDAREVIATELAANLTVAANHLRTQTCTETRIDDLARILDASSKNGSLPPIGDIRRPPRGVWPSGAWESVVASQTATHFARQHLAEMAAAYEVVRRIKEFSQIEITDWNRLYTMMGPGRRLDPVSESELRNALSEARSTSRTISVLGIQLANRVKALQLPFSTDDLNRIEIAKRPPASSASDEICLPIGQATAIYGQGAQPGRMPRGIEEFPEFSSASR